MNDGGTDVIKKFLLQMRTKLYFIPGLFTFFFIALACLFVYIDELTGRFVSASGALFIYTSRAQASVILSTIAGSLLTMLTITFSIMMVVLTIYGSQFSPRSLQDFLEKKATLRILGFFMGSLVFSVISLFSVKAEPADGAVLSPAVAVLLMILAIILFAYFIHYIAKSVQISIYIQNLVKQTAARLDTYLKKVDDDPNITCGNLDDYADIFEGDALEITAEQSGFIQYYDEKKLYALAVEHDIVISCVNSIGKHVTADEVVLRVYQAAAMDKWDELKEQLLELVLIGDETNLYEDIGAGTKKLVEIAVRALSPGINDPGTAVFCVDQIGFLLQKAAKGLEAKGYVDEAEDVRLIVQGITFDRLLFEHFNQIAHYGLKDIVVIDAILGALITICRDNGHDIKEQVWRYSGDLTKKLHLTEYPEYEKQYIRERYYQLARASNQTIHLSELLTSV